MKSYILIIVFMLYLYPALSVAEVIILKNGNAIETNSCWNEDFDTVGYFCKEGTCYIKKEDIDFGKSKLNNILPNDGSIANLPPPIEEQPSTYKNVIQNNSSNSAEPAEQPVQKSNDASSTNLPSDIESGKEQQKTYSISGDLTLIDPNSGDDNNCSGTGGYSDIEGNMQVTIKDGKGNILAVGSTELGHRPSEHGTVVCVFSFQINNVPKADFYSIEVGRRGMVNFSFEEMQKKNWEVHLSLD